MSEQIESYEEMVKKLKPFSIVVNKLSDEEYAKHKVVDDPNRIRDQQIDNYVPNQINTCESDDEQEEELEIDILEEDHFIQNAENAVFLNDTKVYSCFFCKQLCTGYSKAFIHFQLHIDYYPFQCSVCDEAITDLNSFITHCKKAHPELNKAKYIRKYNSNCFNWIENYLNTGLNHNFSDNPHMYCPVCDWIHLSSDVNNPTNDSAQNALKPTQILRHIHEHIQYKPFGCSKCRENGKEFRIHVLDASVRRHLSTHHKEVLEDLPSWKFFNKKFTIPSLDKFIANYLTIFGLKVPKKRIKKRKPKPELITVENNSQKNVLNCDPIKSMPITSSPLLNNSPKSLSVVTPIVMPVMKSNPITYSNNTIVNRMETMTNVLLIYPSSNTLKIPPIPCESTNLGILCVDPRTIVCNDRDFKYICVFCEEKIRFTSKIEACVHYAIHLNYYPINCLLCERKFIDLSALVLHYEKEHVKYENNLFHYLKEDENIENWINGFLDFQKTHEFCGNVSVTYGDYCLVCKKLSQENGIKINSHKNMSAVRDHIYQHLHYFPYKCLICFYGQREVRFSECNSSALNHFTKLHGLANIAPEDNFKLLAKTNEILILEKFVDQNMFPNREHNTELTFNLNLKRKLEDMMQNTDIVNNKLATKLGNNIINTNGLINKIINNNHNNNNNKTNPYLKVNGIVKTLTPKKQTIEYIPNNNTYKEPFLLCFHCHTKVSNTSDLESHHQSKHPKLTIASYSPTKLDVFTH